MQPTAASVPAAAPAIPGDAVHEPGNTLIAWEDGAGSNTFAVGAVVLRLSSKPGSIAPSPVRDVQAPDGTTFDVEGTPGLSTARAEVGVGHVDGASNENQVVFTTFSGGVHCCTGIQVIDRIDGAWRLIDIGGQDGDRLGSFPSDLDGDGTPESKLADDRFLYAFASYAQSWPPPLIKALTKDKVEDVSAAPRLRKVFEDFLPKAQAECEAHNNGACPGFVAAAARAGKADWAWSIMLKNYDRSFVWALPTPLWRRLRMEPVRTALKSNSGPIRRITSGSKTAASTGAETPALRPRSRVQICTRKTPSLTASNAPSDDQWS